MDVVSAFVGHSYSAADELVVGKFLEFLTSQARDNPKFSWDHAKLPEAKGISEKVLEHFRGKNCFIGICTKKERVIAEPPSPLTIVNRLIVASDKITWKTSDWVIQEVGLSVGRGMSLILLMEEGVRAPGGLQADAEWIEFNRNEPERCFIKLANAIKSMTPAAGAPASTGVAPIGDATAAAEKTDGDAIDLTTPKPDWRQFDYQFAYMILISDGEVEKAKSLSDTYEKSPLAAIEGNLISWRATTERLKIEFEQGGSAAALRNLAKENPTHPAPMENLARVSAHFDDTVGAGELFQQAAELAKEPKEIVRLMGRASLEFARAGRLEVAKSILDELRLVADKAGGLETEVLTITREVTDVSAQNDFSIGVMERFMELRPEDKEERFKLAYAQSSVGGSEEMALHHYEAIPPRARTGVTWNNLGVAARASELPAMAVAAFKEGAAAGTPLAKANLAAAYETAGFIVEGEELCRAALEDKDDAPEYANSVLLSIKGVIPKEEEKLKQVRRRARVKSEMYARFGSAASKPYSPIGGDWKGETFHLSLASKRDDFRGQGVRFVTRSPIANALMMGLGETPPTPTQEAVSIEGDILGCALSGHIQNKSSESESLLGSYLNRIPVIGFVDEDGKTLTIVEGMSTASPTVHRLKRVERPAVRQTVVT